MGKEGERSEGWRDENRRHSLVLNMHDDRQIQQQCMAIVQCNPYVHTSNSETIHFLCTGTRGNRDFSHMIKKKQQQQCDI